MLRDSPNGEFVFESEAFENVPEGWRARVTLRVIDDDHFEEMFELAPKGKDLATFLENRWTRVP